MEPFRLFLRDEILDRRAVEALSFPPVHPAQIIIVDLKAVRFADSSGLGWLVRLHHDHPGQVVLSEIHPRLERCLKRIDPSLRPPPWDDQEPISRIQRRPQLPDLKMTDETLLEKTTC